MGSTGSNVKRLDAWGGEGIERYKFACRWTFNPSQ